ncbi:MAG TPA: hypothetical protein VIH48_00800 [Candidatus Bathyarchaeia archaeon]
MITLNVIIPAGLLGGDFQVLIDDIPVNCSLTKNDTHALLYFIHDHSTHNIKIKETTVIPEFPATIILSLSMFLTLVAIALAKKIQCKTRMKTT